MLLQNNIIGIRINGIIGADKNVTNLKIVNDILEKNYNNASEFKLGLEEDFCKMAESVNQYGGFYVGRYETSINEGKAQSVKGKESATSETTSGKTWYGLYAIQKKYETDSVKGSMIWGSQYDAMMTWLGDAAHTTIGDNRNKTIETGNVKEDKIKNIYDLYGNRFEWTLEADSDDMRIIRGGGKRVNQPPSYRRGESPTLAESSAPRYEREEVGARITLYVKL